MAAPVAVALPPQQPPVGLPPTPLSQLMATAASLETDLRYTSDNHSDTRQRVPRQQRTHCRFCCRRSRSREKRNRISKTHRTDLSVSASCCQESVL